ncbi:MAG TPA: efflux RND transporter periplasmic adaptor subunit [Terriglobales bacterium]
MEDLKQQLQSLKIDREPRSSGRWKWIAWILLLVLLMGGFRYGMKYRADHSGVEVETVRPSIRSVSGPQPGAPLLSASGYVVARRKAVVSAKIQGRLSELRVEEGSHVKEGEVIARLESTDYEANIERSKAAIVRAEADLAEAQRQAGIAEKLAQEKVLSTDQRDAAMSKVRLAEAALVQAKADLNYNQTLYEFTLIRAPFTGVVVKKMAEVGESVAPIPPGVNLSTSSGAIVAMADMDSLEVEVDVNESNVSRLGSHQPAEITVQAFGDRRFRGELRQIIPTADRTKATVTVKVAFIDKDRDIKPEMSANVTFLEKTKPSAKDNKPQPVTYLPRDSVVTRSGNPVVFEIQNGIVKEKPVTLGGESNGDVVVKSGLNGDEVLVSKPTDSLKSGDRVHVKG